MKRITYILIVIFYVLYLSGTAYSVVPNSIPKKFTATGMIYHDPIPPFHWLQNIMKFEFIDGEEIHEKFTILYGNDDAGYGPSEHIVDFYLTYDMDAVKNNEEVFIKGTFTYYHDFKGSIREYKGTVTGRLVDKIDQVDMTYDDRRNMIMLSLDVTNADWVWDIYLQTRANSWSIGSATVSKETSPHLPSSSKQKDVAVGVALSTLGIVLLNALTKTTVTGAVSFNLASSVHSTQTPASADPLKNTKGVLNFFKNILLRLRDMLTDEGRSYASGKISKGIKQTGDLDSDQ